MSIFDVGFEVGALRKRLGANGTLKRTKAAVRIRVTLQFGWSYEGLAAFLAFVAQPVCQVATHAITLETEPAAAAAAKTAKLTAITQKAIATSKDLNRTRGIPLY